jgi:hypothetical protein
MNSAPSLCVIVIGLRQKKSIYYWAFYGGFFNIVNLIQLFLLMQYVQHWGVIRFVFSLILPVDGSQIVCTYSIVPFFYLEVGKLYCAVKKIFLNTICLKHKINWKHLWIKHLRIKWYSPGWPSAKFSFFALSHFRALVSKRTSPNRYTVLLKGQFQKPFIYLLASLANAS